MQQEMILVLDFGGQYNQLIARRVRECHVYAEVHPHTLSVEKIREMNPSGIIFTGGPNSVFGSEAVLCDPDIFKLGIPILGICYGAQLMAHMLGGWVATAPVSEYGETVVQVNIETPLFRGIGSPETICWMSHTDYIAKVPDGFEITAHTDNCPVAAMQDTARKFYAVQFHPAGLLRAVGVEGREVGHVGAAQLVQVVGEGLPLGRVLRSRGAEGR